MPSTPPAAATVVAASPRAPLVRTQSAAAKHPPAKDEQWPCPPTPSDAIPLGDASVTPEPNQYSLESCLPPAATEPRTPTSRAVLEAAYSQLRLRRPGPLADALLADLDTPLRAHRAVDGDGNALTADDHFNFRFFCAMREVFIAAVWQQWVVAESAAADGAAADELDRLVDALMRGQQRVREYWGRRLADAEPRRLAEQTLARMNAAIMLAPGSDRWLEPHWPRLVLAHLSSPAKRWCGRRFRRYLRAADKIDIPWDVFAAAFAAFVAGCDAHARREQLHATTEHPGGLPLRRAITEACLDEPYEDPDAIIEIDMPPPPPQRV